MINTLTSSSVLLIFFFQAEDGIRDGHVTGVQTCALPISLLDAKHHYSPVGLEVSEGFARITNRYAFSDLSHLRAEVSLDGQASWQHLELPEVAPGEAAELELPTGGGPAVTVRLLTREAQGPVPADHLIIAADHVDADALATALPAMSVAQSPQRDEDGSWQLGPARFDDLGRLVRSEERRVGRGGGPRG